MFDRSCYYYRPIVFETLKLKFNDAGLLFYAYSHTETALPVALEIGYGNVSR